MCQELAQNPAPEALAPKLFIDADLLQVRDRGIRVQLAAPDALAFSDDALDVSAPVEECDSKIRGLHCEKGKRKR